MKFAAAVGLSSYPVKTGGGNTQKELFIKDHEYREIIIIHFICRALYIRKSQSAKEFEREKKGLLKQIIQYSKKRK